MLLDDWVRQAAPAPPDRAVTLTPRQRRARLLVKKRGLPLQEAARELGITQGSLSTLLSEGRRRLRARRAQEAQEAAEVLRERGG